VRRADGRARAGLWAAGITAIAPLAVWYSVEARAYELYLLLATVALWQFTAAAGEGRPRHWVGFAAAAIAGAYSHYYFGLLIAIAGLTWLGTRPRGERLQRGLIAFAVIAAATAPSLWLLKHDLDQPWGYARTSRFTLPGLAYTYFSYLSGYTLGPSLRELHTAEAREAAIAAAPWAAVLGVATTALLGMAWSHFAPGERWRRAGWFAAFCLAPAAIIGGVSLAAGFGYNVRHAVWAFAPLAALLAVGAAYGRPRGLAWSAAAVLGLAFVAAHCNRLASLEHRNEDVRAVAERLIAADVAAPTFVASGYMSKPLAAYLPADWPVVALPDATGDEEAPAQATAEVRSRTVAGKEFWFVYSREFHGDPRGELLAALRAAFKLEPVGEFAGVRLFHGVAR
jgi:hypothetical protein